MIVAAGPQTRTASCPKPCEVKKFDSTGTAVLVIAVEAVQSARRADVFALPLLCGVVRVLARGGNERELEIVVLGLGVPKIGFCLQNRPIRGGRPGLAHLSPQSVAQSGTIWYPRA